MRAKIWFSVGGVLALLVMGALLRELLPSRPLVARSASARLQEPGPTAPVVESPRAPRPFAPAKAALAPAPRPALPTSEDRRGGEHAPFRTGGPEDVQSFAAEFAKEGVDVAWARETRAALEVGLKPLENEQAKIERIECKDKLCRIDGAFADNDARLRFLRKGFLMAKESAMFSLNAEIYSPPPSKTDDGLESYVYVIRP